MNQAGRCGKKMIIVCMDCNTEMTCSKNGMLLSPNNPTDKVIVLYRADLYKCKECGKEVASNTGKMLTVNSEYIKHRLHSVNFDDIHFYYDF